MYVLVGIGYSGFPRGCSDSVFPWRPKDDSTDWLHTKDPYICDAVSNAILNKCTPDVAGARIYVMEYPNSESAKVIIQSGIQQVIVLGTGQENQEEVEIQAGRILLSMAGVDVRYHTPSISSLLLDFVGTMTPRTPSDDSLSSADEALERERIEREQKQTHLAKKLLLREVNYDASLVKDNGKSRNYISWQDYL